MICQTHRLLGLSVRFPFLLIMILLGFAASPSYADCITYDGTMEDVAVDVWYVCFSDGGIDNVMTGFSAMGPYAMLTGFYSEVGGWGNHGWIEFYSLADPFARTLLRHYQSSADLLCFASGSLGGHYAFYVACDGSGDYLLRVADLTSDPFVTSIFPYGGDVLAVGELGYNSEFEIGAEMTTFRVVDLSVWSLFPVLGSISLPAAAQSLQIRNELAYLLMSDDMLRVVDVSEPTSMSVASSLLVPGFTGCFAVVGNVGCLGTDSDFVQMLDLAEPRSPQLVGSPQAQPGPIASLAIESTRLYVGVRNNGLYVYDITEPASPRYRGSVAFPGLQSLSIAQNHLWIDDGCDIQILPLDCIPTGVGDGVADLPGNPVTLHVHPNPFNPRTMLTLTLAAPDHIEIAIYDLQGRLVRSLVNGPVPAGQATVFWDGTDATGRPRGSGVYLARCTGNRIKASRKLVLTR